MFTPRFRSAAPVLRPWANAVLGEATAAICGGERRWDPRHGLDRPAFLVDRDQERWPAAGGGGALQPARDQAQAGSRVEVEAG